MKKIAILSALIVLGFSSYGQEHVDRDGATVYTQTCLMCHDPLGDKGLAGAKNLIISTMSYSSTTAIVRDGKGAMIAYCTMLYEVELENIVVYIKTLRTKEEEESH